MRMMMMIIGGGIGGLTTARCESVSNAKVYPVAFTGYVRACRPLRRWNRCVVCFGVLRALQKA